MTTSWDGIVSKDLNSIKLVLVEHGKTLTEITKRLNSIDSHLEKMDGRLEELAIEVGAVKTRLGNVEHVVNVLASKAGVESVPALGGSGKSPARMIDA